MKFKFKPKGKSSLGQIVKAFDKGKNASKFMNQPKKKREKNE